MALWTMIAISIASFTITTAALRPLRAKHASESLARLASSVVLTMVQKLSLVATTTGGLFMLLLVMVSWMSTGVDAGALPEFINAVHRMRETAEALDQRLTGAILLVTTLTAALLLHRVARRIAISGRQGQVQAVQARLAELPTLPDTPAMAAVREKLQHAKRVLLSYAPEQATPVARYESLRQKVPELERRLTWLDADRRVAPHPFAAATTNPRLRLFERTLAFFTSRGFVNLLDGSSKLVGILVLAFWFASLIGLQINGASRMATPVAARLQNLVVEHRSQEALSSWFTKPEKGPTTSSAYQDDPADFEAIENDTVLAIARWYELTQVEGLNWVPVDSAGVVFHPHIPPWPSGAGGSPPESRSYRRQLNGRPWPWSGSPETPAGRDFATILSKLREERLDFWHWIVARWRAGIGEFSIPADEHQLVGLALGKIISSAGGTESIPNDLRPVAEEFLEDLGEATGRRYARSRMLRLIGHWISGVNKQSGESYALHTPFPMTSRERATLARAAAALNEIPQTALSTYVGEVSQLETTTPDVATADVPAIPPELTPSRPSNELLQCEKQTCTNGHCGPWLPYSGPECLNAPVVGSPRRFP